MKYEKVGDKIRLVEKCTDGIVIKAWLCSICDKYDSKTGYIRKSCNKVFSKIVKSRLISRAKAKTGRRL